MKTLLSLCVICLTAAASAQPASPTDPPARPNVLFIAIDDLRPELGAYGHPMVRSENLDRLAGQGLIFDRAYCQAALCAPSRTSLMSGLRPGVPGITATDSRDEASLNAVLETVTTLPQHLRRGGYRTLSVGKIFHTYETMGSDPWDEVLKPGGGTYQLAKNKNREQTYRQKVKQEGPSARWRNPRGDASEAADVPDDQYQTHRIASRGIRLLDEHVENHPDQPFFLAVGFYKPHLPFIAPQRYWDLYDRQQLTVPPTDEPQGMPEYALVPSWYEVRQYGDIPRQTESLDQAKARELIHGYYACISFVDAQVGRLLESLDQHGLADNTVVIVWSDHGFKLGDYGDWSKYTNMEIDTRVPLIVKGPRVTAGRTDALVELIDLYPTVAELTGNEVPKHVEGTSFVPLLSDPDRPWKSAALSYYDRRNPDGEGFSIRDARYRYTEWREYETGRILARELYDHAEGPIAQRNLADDPAHAETRDRLQSLLAEGWSALTPPAADPRR